MKLLAQSRCFAACAALSCSLGVGRASNAQSEVVTVYQPGGDVSAPKLIPTTFSTDADSGCEKPLSGTVTVATIVDASGQPRNTMFVQPARNALDKLALNMLSAERFSPGEKNGAPVAVSQTVAMVLEACVSDLVDANGKQQTLLRSTAQPKLQLSPCNQYAKEAIFAVEASAADLGTKSGPKVYRLSDGVSAPMALWENKPILVGHGDKVKYEGEVLVSLIVDAHGMPQRVKVVRPLGMGLDEKAFEATNGMRFKPALLKGKQPVPVELAVKVAFRLY